MARKRPIQPQESFVDFHFPVKGIDLSQAYDRQPADTTPEGQNVRAYDVLAARARGGQRPGLAKYNPAPVPGAALIQDLNTVVGVGYAAPGPAGAYVLQGFGVPVTGTNPQVGTFPQPVTAGNLIVVCVGSFGGFPSGVTDGGGNTYTRLTNSSLAAASATIWTATATTGGFTTVSVNGLAGPPTAGFMVPFEVASPGVLDVAATGTGVNTFGTPNPLVTTTAGDLAFQVVCLNSSAYSVTGVSGGWLLVKQQSGVAVYTQVLGGAGSYAPTWNYSTNTDWASAGAAYT